MQQLLVTLASHAMNEGTRWKKRLWSEQGRSQLEKIRLAPWASRRRQDLLELLDRMNPTIVELRAAAEQEAKKRPEVLRPPIGGFVFEPSRLCRHPSIRTLLLSDFRSVRVERSHFSRCCYLIAGDALRRHDIIL
jgi:hypothetical protein